MKRSLPAVHVQWPVPCFKARIPPARRPAQHACRPRSVRWAGRAAPARGRRRSAAGGGASDRAVRDLIVRVAVRPSNLPGRVPARRREDLGDRVGAGRVDRCCLPESRVGREASASVEPTCSTGATSHPHAPRLPVGCTCRAPTASRSSPTPAACPAQGVAALRRGCSTVAERPSARARAAIPRSQQVRRTGQPEHCARRTRGVDGARGSAPRQG
jgi:hypothetical protein